MCHSRIPSRFNTVLNLPSIAAIVTSTEGRDEDRPPAFVLSTDGVAPATPAPSVGNAGPGTGPPFPLSWPGQRRHCRAMHGSDGADDVEHNVDNDDLFDRFC